MPCGTATFSICNMTIFAQFHQNGFYMAVPKRPEFCGIFRIVTLLVPGKVGSPLWSGIVCENDWWFSCCDWPSPTSVLWYLLYIFKPSQGCRIAALLTIVLFLWHLNFSFSWQNRDLYFLFLALDYLRVGDSLAIVLNNRSRRSSHLTKPYFSNVQGRDAITRKIWKSPLSFGAPVALATVLACKFRSAK